MVLFLPICVLSCFCFLLPASLRSIYSLYWQTLEPYVLASVKVYLSRKERWPCTPGMDSPAPEVQLQASDVLRPHLLKSSTVQECHFQQKGGCRQESICLQTQFSLWGGIKRMNWACQADQYCFVQGWQDFRRNGDGTGIGTTLERTHIHFRGKNSSSRQEDV